MRRSKRQCISGRLLLREAMKLARLRGDEELLFNDVDVGNATPQPAKQIAALFGELAGPGRFGVGPAEPFSNALDCRFAAAGIQVRSKRAVDGKRFQQAGIVLARRITHQCPDPARVIDKRLEVGAAAWAFRGFENETLESCLLQIIVERRVVL